jgi:hypothetical protein
MKQTCDVDLHSQIFHLYVVVLKGNLSETEKHPATLKFHYKQVSDTGRRNSCDSKVRFWPRSSSAARPNTTAKRFTHQLRRSVLQC